MCTQENPFSLFTDTLIKKMRVSELEQELSFRGLPTSGNKGELVERLMTWCNHHRAEQQLGQPVDPPGAQGLTAESGEVPVAADAEDPVVAGAEVPVVPAAEVPVEAGLPPPLDEDMVRDPCVCRECTSLHVRRGWIGVRERCTCMCSAPVPAQVDAQILDDAEDGV